MGNTTSQFKLLKELHFKGQLPNLEFVQQIEYSWKFADVFSNSKLLSFTIIW